METHQNVTIIYFHWMRINLASRLFPRFPRFCLTFLRPWLHLGKRTLKLDNWHNLWRKGREKVSGRRSATPRTRTHCNRATEALGLETVRLASTNSCTSKQNSCTYLETISKTIRFTSEILEKLQQIYFKNLNWKVLLIFYIRIYY